MEIEHVGGTDSNIQCVNNKESGKNAEIPKYRPKPNLERVWITQEGFRGVRSTQEAEPWI
jgi:hypothetical protein